MPARARAGVLSSNSSDLENAAYIILVAAVIVITIWASVILLPFAVAGVGGIYYWRNIYGPKRQSRIEARRTTILHQEALEHASVGDGFFGQLDKAGIMDEQLREVAHELYRLEGLVPPEKPAGLSDTIQAARYQNPAICQQVRRVLIAGAAQRAAHRPGSRGWII